MEFLACVFLGFLALFLLSYFQNKTRLINGFLLWCCIASLGVFILLWLYFLEIPILTNLMVAALALVFALVVLFGIYIFIGLLLINARVVFKKERKSLSNSLTLLLAAALIVMLVAAPFISWSGSPWLNGIYSGIFAILFVYFFVLASFLTSVLLCNLARPAKKQDYIIVLGSGLVNGEVSPLLAGRINRAIRFYQKQKKRGGKPLY